MRLHYSVCYNWHSFWDALYAYHIGNVGLSLRTLLTIQPCIDVCCITDTIHNLLGRENKTRVFPLSADPVGLEGHHGKPLCSTCYVYPYALKQRHISDQNHLFLLLMCLHPEFESLWGHLLYRDSLPTLKTNLKELMGEETHLPKLGSLFVGHSTYALATPRPSATLHTSILHPLALLLLVLLVVSLLSLRRTRANFTIDIVIAEVMLLLSVTRSNMQMPSSASSNVLPL